MEDKHTKEIKKSEPTQKNPIKQEQDSSINVKKRFDWEKAHHIATFFISIIVIVFSVVLILGISSMPEKKDTNYIEKANAGDVYSQMFLAEHYYETGDYANAIYWYKIAATTDSEYQAYAYNNLGVLYAKGYGLSEEELAGYRRYEKSLQLFQAASSIDEKFDKNIWILLKGNSEECFPNVAYNSLVASMQFDEMSIVEIAYYEYKEISFGGVFWEGNKKYTYLGLVSVPNPRINGLTHPYYLYYVQEYRDDSRPLTDYYFVYLDDTTSK